MLIRPALNPATAGSRSATPRSTPMPAAHGTPRSASRREDETTARELETLLADAAARGGALPPPLPHPPSAADQATPQDAAPDATLELTQDGPRWIVQLPPPPFDGRSGASEATAARSRPLQDEPLGVQRQRKALQHAAHLPASAPAAGQTPDALTQALQGRWQLELPQMGPGEHLLLERREPGAALHLSLHSAETSPWRQQLPALERRLREAGHRLAERRSEAADEDDALLRVEARERPR